MLHLQAVVVQAAAVGRAQAEVSAKAEAVMLLFSPPPGMFGALPNMTVGINPKLKVGQIPCCLQQVAVVVC